MSVDRKAVLAWWSLKPSLSAANVAAHFGLKGATVRQWKRRYGLGGAIPQEEPKPKPKAKAKVKEPKPKAPKAKAEKAPAKKPPRKSRAKRAPQLPAVVKREPLKMPAWAKRASTMGPPTRLTPERQELICDLIRSGVSNIRACRGSGIAQSTYYRWLDQGKTYAKSMADSEGEPPIEGHQIFYEFMVAMDEAQAQAEIALVLKVSGDDDWRAAMALLKARYPDRYADKRTIDATVTVKEPRGVPQVVVFQINELHGPELNLIAGVDLDHLGALRLPTDTPQAQDEDQ